MDKLLVPAAMAMAAFPDFAVGCFIATVIALTMDVPIQWWYLPLGGILALLPDFDILEPVVQRLITGKQITGNHREATVLHRPLVILPTVTLAAWAFGGEYWAVTAFLCVLAHYVHDARETGSDGLAWFWPISKKYWWIGGSFEPRYNEIEDWLERTWLKPSERSITEMIIGTSALILALNATVGLSWTVGITGVVCLGAVSIWLLQAIHKP